MQIPKLEETLSELTRQLEIFEKKVAKLEDENQRINQLYQKKVYECEQLRNRCNALDSQVINLKNIEKQLPVLENRINGLNAEVNKLTRQLKERNVDLEKANQSIAKMEVQIRSYLELQKEFARLKNQYQTRL